MPCLDESFFSCSCRPLRFARAVPGLALRASGLFGFLGEGKDGGKSPETVSLKMSTPYQA